MTNACSRAERLGVGEKKDAALFYGKNEPRPLFPRGKALDHRRRLVLGVVVFEVVVFPGELRRSRIEIGFFLVVFVGNQALSHVQTG
jgi:hypothetical protein